MDILNDLARGAISSSLLEKEMCTLAAQKARCMEMLDSGVCEKEECCGCRRLEEWHECMDRLSTVGRMRVEQQAEDMATAYVSRRAAHEARVKQKRSADVKALVIFVVCLLFVARACVGEEIDLGARVDRILEITRGSVRDIDGDGDVDCVDWSYTFKAEWDRRYPTTCCILLYNSKGDFRHMLVAVRLFYSDRLWTHVEPQAAPGNWDPVRFWKGRYDPGRSVQWPM